MRGRLVEGILTAPHLSLAPDDRGEIRVDDLEIYRDTRSNAIYRE